MRFIPRVAAGILLSTISVAVLAGETPIGQAVEKNGMEIGAVYLQSVVMEPAMPMEGPTDIHLEADIHAVKGNPLGFGVGEWIPSLQVAYHLTKEGSTWSQTGVFMPMVASDGPHYGANVKLDGPGKYHVTYHLNPPPYSGFVRHTDKETGVGKWWTPFDVSWDFAYVGTGKKGGY
jgi:uncharacterized protein involved in high-affinity Fe2+ transport